MPALLIWAFSRYMGRLLCVAELKVSVHFLFAGLHGHRMYASGYNRIF